MSHRCPPASVSCVEVQPVNNIDLIALSDAAWQVVDPDGEHEGEERAWSAAIEREGPPIRSLQELRGHLDGQVAALAPQAAAAPLSAVAAVMVFLAAHPDRHDRGGALLGDALRNVFGSTLPAQLASWLAAWHAKPGAHRRTHGAPHPRRTPARPAPADLAP